MMTALAILVGTIGAVLIYAAVKNKNPLDVFTSALRGEKA